MDTQPIGNDKSNLRLAVDKFNTAVKLYFAGLNHSHLSTDAAVTKHFYSVLVKRLLKLKTTPLPKSTVYDLFDVYKTLKTSLNASYFKAAPFILDSDAKEFVAKADVKFQTIPVLYAECKEALDQIVPNVEDLSDVHIPSFNVKNVLVGSLRNHDQLDICCNKGFYHVPAASMPMDAEAVEYVAIYQSKNFFGKNAGIVYYGKVSSYDLVQRCDITEIPKMSNAMYYKFCVHWQKLPERIRCTGSGKLFWASSLFLLLRAKDVCELDFTDFDEYLLYCSIYRFAQKPPKKEVYNRWRDVVLAISSAGINVYKNDTGVYHASLKEYLSNPGYHFRRIVLMSSKNKE